MFRHASQANLWMQLDGDPDDMRKVKPPVDGHKLDKDVTMLIGQSGSRIAEWGFGRSWESN